VGVLQRFERRLEGFVEGAFARVFGGVVQPVEVAAALQREAADKKAVVGQGRVLVPNDYVVELGRADAERLSEYDAALRKELAAMVDEHAAEQGWSFVGPVAVRFETVESLDTGVFRVRSSVVAAPDWSPAPGETPTGAVRTSRASGRPELVLTGPIDKVIPLLKEVTVIGRGADADLRLADTGVSRAHAELALAGDTAVLTDLRSTNGTSVNGDPITRATLADGDRIRVGGTTLVFRSSA
jgi:hypothetical protein